MCMSRLWYILIALGLVIPAFAYAAPVNRSLEVSGWIPYWRAQTGTEDTLPHLEYVTTVHPFSFNVSGEGEIEDTLNIESSTWGAFIDEARQRDVRVIPTIMWNDGAAMHKVFSDRERREAFVADIVQLVEDNGFDGIDIDFESKLAETKDHYSAFLRELYRAMGNKWVYCTIESRTPLTSRYDTIPANIEYANDYKEINKYCDRVQIMAYDQGTIDLKLSRAAAGPYAPVADSRWAEKVIRDAAKTISKKKIVLGIPTYGYEWQIEPLSASTFSYKKLWAFNPGYALEVAGKLGLAPKRNTAGEMQLLYLPQMLTDVEPANDASAAKLGVPATPLSNVATAPTLRPSFNLITWGDAESVKQKIALAKKLGIRGVAIFKFDGGQDQKIWDVLAGR